MNDTGLKKLKNELGALYYAYLHPEAGLLPKVIIAIALGYALSPIDLIPDFIPVLGLLDDMIVIPLLIGLSVRLIPDEIMQECRRKAKEEPPGLRKNRMAAVLFIAVWILLLYFIAKLIFKLFLKGL